MREKKQAVCNRGANLVGVQVATANRETIGNVEDLVIDLGNGRITSMVIAVQLGRGEGEALVAVPWDAISFDVKPESHRVVLQMSKQELTELPTFSRKTWPPMDDAVWAQCDGKHESHGAVEPAEEQNADGSNLRKELPLG